eukprot:gene9068-biopygen8956
MRVPSLNGSLYFQSILDDHSKYSLVTFHKAKKTVPQETMKEHAERLNRTLHNRATALLQSSKFPNRVFKLSPSAKITRLVGYYTNMKAYRVLLPDHTIQEVRDVTLNEDHSFITPNTVQGSYPNDEPQNSTPDHPALDDPTGSDKIQQTPNPANPNTTLPSGNTADSEITESPGPPSLEPPGTSALDPRDEDMDPVRTIFDLKTLVSGEIDRFKARLVTEGYAQRPGMDYDEVSAPVAKHATIRFILSMAAEASACLAQLDLSTAFLNDIVEEELYCAQPPGFEEYHRVCRTWKCLYGLKQASCQWYVRERTDMISIGLKEVDIDQGLFILPGPTCRPLIWVLLWVDDFILLSFHNDILREYNETIMNLNKIRDLREPSVFVGYEITRNATKGTLHICQSRFIQELLKSVNILAEPGSMKHPHHPLNPEAPLPYPAEGDPPTGLPFAQIVGSLNYLTVNTRPGIAQAVNRLARHSAHPMQDHMEAATGILKYLAGTPDHEITYTFSTKPLTG